MQSETDQLGRTTSYEYDSVDRMVAFVQPAVLDPTTGQMVQPRTEFTYDICGNQTSTKDALGRVTSYTFDPYGQQLTRTLPGGAQELSTYNQFGQVQTHTDFAGQATAYTYDSQGRTETESYLPLAP